MLSFLKSTEIESVSTIPIAGSTTEVELRLEVVKICINKGDNTNQLLLLIRIRYSQYIMET